MMTMPKIDERVAVILLAAGESKRMGQPKQLLPWSDTTLVRHAAQIALASGARLLIVVLGSHAAEVRAALADLAAGPTQIVTIVENPDYASGMASSLRSGISALPAQTAAALVMLVDQPLVRPELLDALVERWVETEAPLVVPRYQGRRGNPVVVAQPLFHELLALSGDAGARTLFERYRTQIAWVEADEAAVTDVDSPESYQALLDEVNRKS